MPISTKVAMKQIVAALKMPIKIGDKIDKARGIQDKLKDGAAFLTSFPANLTPPLEQLDADINALVEAEAAARNKIPGSIDVRDTALNNVLNDLKSIMNIVQAKADESPANAKTIIMAAGYDVKKTGIKQKQQNDVRNTQVSGTIIVTAEGTGPHQWQKSKDKIELIDLPDTISPHTIVSGLKYGNVWYFRSRKIAADGERCDWCDWMEITIS